MCSAGVSDDKRTGCNGSFAGYDLSGQTLFVDPSKPVAFACSCSLSQASPRQVARTDHSRASSKARQAESRCTLHLVAIYTRQKARTMAASCKNLSSERWQQSVLKLAQALAGLEASLSSVLNPAFCKHFHHPPFIRVYDILYHKGCAPRYVHASRLRNPDAFYITSPDESPVIPAAQGAAVTSPWGGIPIEGALA